MNREEIIDLFKDTYKQTLEDNKDDFQMLYKCMSNLCFKLLEKNILDINEVKNIIDIQRKED